jgi:acyl dehydratase
MTSTESRNPRRRETAESCAIQVERPPNLLALYARAVLTRHGGDQLPTTQVVLRNQAIDADHLAVYQRVCGFRVRDELPPTYLHVLAFPLAISLMVAPTFPFPLVGLVHLANVIERRRPVRMDETVSITVAAADLRGHESGRTVDLIAEAMVGEDTVWRSRSTYLRRGKPSKAKTPRPPSEPPTGTAITIRVPGDIGRRYAAVSGDRNPIHLHPLTARAFGFPRAIAHGMWLKARTLAGIEERLPDAFTAAVAFKTPVLLPSTISLVAVHHDDAWTLDVRSAKSGKPHLTGSVTPL